VSYDVFIGCSIVSRRLGSVGLEKGITYLPAATQFLLVPAEILDEAAK
jgi:hypothetical protein